MIVLISFCLLNNTTYHIDRHKIKWKYRIKTQKIGNVIRSLDNAT